jgi:Protein of unknown function (DUF3141)
MPPGLYEAVISGIDDTVENPELIQGDYLFSLERRSLDDIRALGGNSPEDDLAFATAARVSEINQGLYRTVLGPAVSAMATQSSAEFSRRMHPNRLRFQMFADENPLMQPVARCAEWVRDNRRPVSPNNVFLGFERMMSDMIAGGLEAWGKTRDAMQEALFFGTYRSPLLQGAVGLRADGTSADRRIERDLTREAMKSRMAAYLEQQIDRGGLIEAVLRALIYVRLSEGTVDERGLAALREVGAALPAAKRIGFARLKEVLKEQFLMMILDEERAIAALPKLLTEGRKERELGLAAVRRVLAARGALSAEGSRRLARIESLFNLPAAAIPAEQQPESVAE